MLFALTLAMQTGAAAQQILLNEIEIDEPSTESGACQYTELVGTPGTTVPANTFFVSVNSDAGNFGFANQAVNVGGLVVGSNGTITLFNMSQSICPNRVFPAGTTLLNYTNPLRVGTGSEAYLVIRATGNVFSGLDLDSDDDGIFNAALGITVLDGFALLVNPKEEYVYGAEAGVVNISNNLTLDQPDAVTRFGGNTTPFSINSFYFGELAPSPDETTQYAAPFSPNFPTGGMLTPGAPNVPTQVAPGKAVVDFNGDGRTDYSIVRNQGGSLVWFTAINGTTETRGTQFGAQNDVSVPEDYDGDGKDDIAVWRAGVQGFFYILQSSNNTFRTEAFGQTGDHPTIVGDWDNDNKADVAVYRSAAAAGGQSFFYYRPSAQPGVNFNLIRWGTNGDVPQRGDFDGDGRQDAAVFRPSDLIWYIVQSSNSQPRYERWGAASDRRVPADYDGDGKTDLAVFRDGLWAVLQSSNNQQRYQQFGQSGDVPVPGDYNGDGRSDFALYRQGVFYAAPSSGGSFTAVSFGVLTDFPTANVFTN